MLIYDAMDEGVEELEKSPDTVLVGELDSMGLIDLILAVEGKVDEEFDVTLSLLEDEKGMAVDSPFKDVSSLARHIASLLDKGLG